MSRKRTNAPSEPTVVLTLAHGTCDEVEVTDYGPGGVTDKRRLTLRWLPDASMPDAKWGDAWMLLVNGKLHCDLEATRRTGFGADYYVTRTPDGIVVYKP